MSLDVPQSALAIAGGRTGDGMQLFNHSATAFFETPTSWLRVRSPLQPRKKSIPVGRNSLVSTSSK